MVVSHFVADTTLKKAMSLRIFLKLLYDHSNLLDKSESSDTHASVLAQKSGELLGLSRAFVYRAYREWRDGQEAKAI